MNILSPGTKGSNKELIFLAEEDSQSHVAHMPYNGRYTYLKVKSSILRNIQLQKKRSYCYTCNQEIYRLTTLDYGQLWQVLNPIPKKNIK